MIFLSVKPSKVKTVAVDLLEPYEIVCFYFQFLLCFSAVSLKIWDGSNLYK